MSRITKTLALAAAVLAGAFGATAAQASANFNVDFKVHNADSTVSMIRETVPLPSDITGLINPPSAIAAGGNDPGSGNALWSDSLPNLGQSTSASVVYARASDGGNSCTFTMKITHDTNALPYLLEISVSDAPRCGASATSARSSNGNFTSTTYQLNWANGT